MSILANLFSLEGLNAVGTMYSRVVGADIGKGFFSFGSNVTIFDKEFQSSCNNLKFIECDLINKKSINIALSSFVEQFKKVDVSNRKFKFVVKNKFA